MTDPSFVLDHAETEPEKVRETLVAMHERGETVAEIVAFVEALEQRKIRVETPDHWQVFDVCGTGGSGRKRINLSTALALMLSKKFKIAKHGNKAASGRVGSFDLVEKVGYEVGDTPEKVVAELEEKNLAFVFAPAFHPALKALAPIRKSIPHPTIFNYLGPLLNPVKLTGQMTGVASTEIGEKLAEVAAERGQNVLFVHDVATGLDDVSICGETRYWRVVEGTIESGSFVPEDHGLQRVSSIQAIEGGETVEENEVLFQALLDGTAPKAHLDFLAINATFAGEFFEYLCKKE